MYFSGSPCASNLGIFRALNSKSEYLGGGGFQKTFPTSIPIISTLRVPPPSGILAFTPGKSLRRFGKITIIWRSLIHTKLLQMTEESVNGQWTSTICNAPALLSLGTLVLGKTEETGNSVESPIGY